MKRKIIVSIVIVALVLIGMVCANSYAQAFYKQERMINYNNVCQQNENCPVYQQNESCPIYQQNDNCIQQNNQFLQQNNNYMGNCGRRQNCHNRMCNR